MRFTFGPLLIAFTTLSEKSLAIDVGTQENSASNAFQNPYMGGFQAPVGQRYFFGGGNNPGFYFMPFNPQQVGQSGFPAAFQPGFSHGADPSSGLAAFLPPSSGPAIPQPLPDTPLQSNPGFPQMPMNLPLQFFVPDQRLAAQPLVPEPAIRPPSPEFVNQPPQPEPVNRPPQPELAHSQVNQNPAPTSEPVLQKEIQPSQAVSAQPSQAVSAQPTQQASVQPSQAPNTAPTASPTAAPEKKASAQAHTASKKMATTGTSTTTNKSSTKTTSRSSTTTTRSPTPTAETSFALGKVGPNTFPVTLTLLALVNWIRA